MSELQQKHNALQQAFNQQAKDLDQWRRNFNAQVMATNEMQARRDELKEEVKRLNYALKMASALVGDAEHGDQCTIDACDECPHKRVCHGTFAEGAS